MKNTSLVLVIILNIQLYCIPGHAAAYCKGCLYLSPYIEQGMEFFARVRSKNDPESFLGLKSHTGFLNVNKEHGSQHFFWFFPAEKLEVTPWIIWLGGGPGITALKGLFEVMGPMEIKDDKVSLRNITWATDYSLLFLDVPVGAGFSYTETEKGYTDNIEDVGLQMLASLQQFLRMFPELKKAPLFITGQSYAGKYAPALAIQIHKNRNNYPINLRGIAIGNALIDPRNMMKYSQLSTVLGILDDKEIYALKGMEHDTIKYIDEGRMIDAANKFNETIEFIYKRSGVNIYNFLQDKPPNKMPAFEAYLNKQEVRKLIFVGNATFNYNNQKVYKKMLPDICNSTKPFIEELLEHYGVMSYSGQLDIIVAYSFSRNMFKTLNWSKRREYVNAPKMRVYDHEKIVAYRKSGGNFVDVLVRGAGHSVPSDQPGVAKYIIDSFIEQFK